MPQILLINPNTSARTTQQMVQLLQAQLPLTWKVHGVTASVGTPLITNALQLAEAAQQVPACWQVARAWAPWHGVVLACFADPALDWLRRTTGVPTIGIGEAAMRAASHNGQRFGIATTTPDLDSAMRAQAQQLGIAHLYTGAHYSAGPALALLEQPQVLQQQLHTAVQQCVADGAQQVVIGGGPLGQTALALASQVPIPLIAPLSAAAHWLQTALTPHAASQVEPLGLSTSIPPLAAP